MTPLWVNLLAGSMIDIQLTAMVMDVVKIVLIPIGAAILHDYLKTYASIRGRRIVQGLAGLGALWLLYMLPEAGTRCSPAPAPKRKCTPWLSTSWLAVSSGRCFTTGCTVALRY
jgi:hypothetical protein